MRGPSKLLEELVSEPERKVPVRSTARSLISGATSTALRHTEASMATGIARQISAQERQARRRGYLEAYQGPSRP